MKAIPKVVLLDVDLKSHIGANGYFAIFHSMMTKITSVSRPKMIRQITVSKSQG